MGIPNMRRIYYIKRDFQKRFISRYIALIVSGVILSIILLFAIITRDVDSNIYSAHIRASSTGQIIQPKLFMTEIIIFSAAILSIVAYTLISFRNIGSRLHFIAGNIDALKKRDMTVKAGPHNGDQFVELVDVFNKSVSQLSGRFATIKQGVGDIEAACVKIETDRSKSIMQILSNIEILESSLSSFNLKRQV